MDQNNFNGQGVQNEQTREPLPTFDYQQPTYQQPVYQQPVYQQPYQPVQQAYPPRQQPIQGMEMPPRQQPAQAMQTPRQQTMQGTPAPKPAHRRASSTGGGGGGNRRRTKGKAYRGANLIEQQETMVKSPQSGSGREKDA